MNTTEKRFEDKLLQALRDSGFFAIHPNIMNAPGFPDILAIHGKTVSLIEVKTIEKMESLIHKSFQPTQLPFYLNFFRSGGSRCVWIAFDHYGQGHLCLMDTAIAKSWKELSWSYLLEMSCVVYNGPPWYLADQLKHFIESDNG